MTDARDILGIHIPKNEVEDLKFWANTKNGEYLVKTGYWHLLNSQIPRLYEPSKGWKWLWRGTLLPRDGNFSFGTF